MSETIMSIFRKNSLVYTLILSAALFISACTVQFVDPNAAVDGGDSASEMPVNTISAEMPYETQFVEVLGSKMAYVEAGGRRRPHSLSAWESDVEVSVAQHHATSRRSRAGDLTRSDRHG